MHTNFKLKLNIISFVCCISVLSAPAYARKQTALLDADGKPLSMEMLTLISTGKPPVNARAEKPRRSSQKNNRKKNNRVVAAPAKKQLQAGLINKPSKSKPPSERPELQRELLNALKEGRTARAMNLIKSGVKVNYQNYEGETPLSVAVTKAWASIARELLEHGANINHKMPRDLSLLHYASAKGFTDVAKVLIKHGLNPATTTKNKEWNSLHVAARYGNWQLVQMYLDMGVNPNARTSDNKTALEIAQIAKLQGIVKILSRVTSARPMGRAANYDKRLNRKKYDELESFKQAKLARKRAELKELESIKQAKLAHKRAILKEKQAIEWRKEHGKCGPDNVYCIPKLTED